MYVSPGCNSRDHQQKVKTNGKLRGVNLNGRSSVTASDHQERPNTTLSVSHAGSVKMDTSDAIALSLVHEEMVWVHCEAAKVRRAARTNDRIISGAFLW